MTDGAKLSMLYDAGTTGRLDAALLGAAQKFLSHAVKRTADSANGAPSATQQKPGQYTAFAKSVVVSTTGFASEPGGAMVHFEVTRQLSGQLSTDAVTPSPSAIVDRFMDDLDREVRGEACNESVRRYLLATSWSKATALHDGRMIHMSARTSTEKPDRNLARVIEGEVVGVGFEAGSEYVCLREGSDVRRFSANAALVACALELRAGRVRASVFSRGNKVLLSALGPAGKAFGGDADERTARMLARWSSVLQELAK